MLHHHLESERLLYFLLQNLSTTEPVDMSITLVGNQEEYLLTENIGPEIPSVSEQVVFILLFLLLLLVYLGLLFFCLRKIRSHSPRTREESGKTSTMVVMGEENRVFFEKETDLVHL